MRVLSKIEKINFVASIRNNNSSNTSSTVHFDQNRNKRTSEIEVEEQTDWMNMKKMSVKSIILTFMLLMMNMTSMTGQCNCPTQYTTDTVCTDTIILSITANENITDKLDSAIRNFCKIIIPNSDPTSEIIYYTYPLLFSGDDNDVNTAVSDKEIILEAGVVLMGVTGGFSDCSQAVFTFDGNANKNISIHGGSFDECEDELKAEIRMNDVTYIADTTTAYLVASDNVGEPYLDAIGIPNYVYSDGDSDPFFDSNGDPNLIGTGTQSRVTVDCDYNDYLCNRHIIAWCPYSWEARHCIVLQGVENVNVSNLSLDYAAGGDGLHITDSEDFEASKSVFVYNLSINGNARSGISMTNANCVSIDSCFILNTGNVAPTSLVTPRGAIDMSQNTNLGSISPYNSTSPIYAMHSIHIVDCKMNNNVSYDIGFDLPNELSSCSDSLDVTVDNVCITNSEIALLFDHTVTGQDGSIVFSDLNIDNFSVNAIKATVDWLSTLEDVSFTNLDVTTFLSGAVAFNIDALSTFCASTNITVSDLCTYLINTENPFCNLTYTCTSTNSFDCDSLLREFCPGDTSCTINMVVSGDSTYTCCDILFIVDGSGSIDNADWAKMLCTINKTMIPKYKEECANCDIEFALIQFSGEGEQKIEQDFGCDSIIFGSQYKKSTNVSKALGKAYEWLNDGSSLTRTDTSKCLEIVLLTDAEAYCNLPGAGQPPFATDYLDKNSMEWMIAHRAQTNYKVSTNVIYFPPGGSHTLPDCPGYIDDLIGSDGEYQETQFNCENEIDLGFYDIEFSLSVSYSQDCEDPVVKWSTCCGGEIVSISSNKKSIITNGTGEYVVKVECAFGCNDLLIDSINLNNYSNQLGNKSWGPSDTDKRIGIDLNFKPIVDNLVLFPNPSFDIITIELIEPLEGKLKIYNLNGAEIVRFTNILQSQEIDISSWARGMYYLVFEGKNNFQIQKSFIIN